VDDIKALIYGRKRMNNQSANINAAAPLNCSLEFIVLFTHYTKFLRFQSHRYNDVVGCPDSFNPRST
jgi:hypothetical protein